MRALFALALLAAPAAAQDVTQTPEGAQRFLALMAKTVVLQVEEPHRQNGQAFIHFHITKIAQGADVCTSRFDADPNHFAGSQIPANGRDFERFPALVARHGFSAPPFNIDWSKVQLSELTDPQNGNTHLVISSPDRTLYMLALTTDVGPHKRIKYAMQFLKEACDKTADTGF